MQIVLLLLFILAILIAFVSKKDTLSTSIKIYIIVSIALIMALGWGFNFYNTQQADKQRELIKIFEQGNDLKCGDYIVNAKDFTFVTGTLSFVSKGNIQSLKGVVVDISTCKKAP
ncbi:hypothetical protein [Sulfurospirillum sp. 1612]|uniref:hypothetical protein n=1 Tax=Sulfurospirillum sp. 1612 TaxID=3094835 RepID=UPI002F936AB4